MNSGAPDLQALSQQRQHARILRLTFPNGDGPKALLLANKLDAIEELSRDFTFTVEVLAEDARIALADVQGKMVSIELVRSDGSLRYFNGYAQRFQLLKTDGGIAFYQLVLKPWLAYLRLRKDSYLFHQQSLYQQTASIFSDYGACVSWDCQLHGPDAQMTEACQFNESDHNYLHRRWEARGWLYWYEHSASGHKLILSDNSTYAAPLDGGQPIPFQRHAGAIEEDGLGDWSPMLQVGASSVALSSFDFKNPSPQHVNVNTLNTHGAAPAVESYEYTGAYGFAGHAAGEQLSTLRMEEIEAAGAQIEAGGNNRYVQPGRSFEMSGHFDDNAGQQRRQYLLVRVHHEASNNYLQDSGVPAHYDNRLTCILKNTPWRPGRGHHSHDTRIYGIQSATVVGPAGENICVDEYGRVRVQFHWDRIGQDDEHSSAWVRVASGWSGAALGIVTIPRIGQSVLVQWLDGVCDHPIITGSVANQNNMPPWALPAQQSLSGIRSRELAPEAGNAAGGRSGHLVFDDSYGAIQTQLKSDHLHSQLSLGHVTRVEDNAGRKDARGEGFGLETGGAGVLRSARGLLLSTDGRAKAVGGLLSRDELVACLEQALDIAKGLGQAAAQAQGAPRDAQPQQDLSAAVDALGHGAGNESQSQGAAPGGQPVIAISAAAGIASATPKDQTHYAGQNIDTVAGRSQQHYAAQSILSTAGKDIEQFAVDGDIRIIANKGKIVQQAQQNMMEITADKSVTVMSTKEHILVAAEKHVTLTSGGAYIKIGGGNIEIVCPGNLIFKSASRSFTGPGNMSTDMPSFDTGDTGRQFILHRHGDKLDTLMDHNYKIKLDDGEVIEGRTAADGLTKLAEKDVMRIAKIEVWKDPT